jgi:hypothetical protein
MSKKLNITIENIPDDMYKTLWDAAIKSAPVKTSIVPTDVINFNYAHMINLSKRSFVELLSSAVTLNAIVQYSKRNN